jgi:DNA mismatch endonuclease (patch repair protein)
LADVVDSATRSRMMAGIRGANTQPEVRLRKTLHRLGLRFRLHRAGLPGRPDIVFPGRMAAVMVHGCFWHRHPGCRFATVPATRPEFWQEKFRANVERDARNVAALRKLGWRVRVAWECDIRQDVDRCAALIEAWLR